VSLALATGGSTGRFSATESHNSSTTMDDDLHPTGTRDCCFMEGLDGGLNSASQSARAQHTILTLNIRLLPAQP